MVKYKTFTKEKWMYFAFSIVAYFLPFTIVTAVFLPIMKAAKELKFAIGMAVIFINALPFLQGLLELLFSHYPMINTFALIYICISAFFSLDIFQTYRYYFNWIELTAVIGSLVSTVLWAKYHKYLHYQKSVKANVKCGAFALKGEANDKEN